MADPAAAPPPAPAAPPTTTSPAAKKRLPSPLPLLLISLALHLLYTNSIFDIYFRTPVVSVSSRFSAPDTSRSTFAKRVVLFSADGLRADKAFQTYADPPFPLSSSFVDALPPPFDGEEHALVEDAEKREGEDGERRTTPLPFLRGLINAGKAQWGVSHTRVPTESRPGHVAMIGGMYEDVSAVTRGWTTNPVPFDSVFNQSSTTFSFGSPDILPMFSLGSSDPSRVRTWTFSHTFEDFTSDAVHLDLWVLSQLQSLLKNATTDPELDARLRAPGVVFFEHLLGLDTTGHSYRPHGPEYHRNIRVVDHIVSATVALLEEFYGHDGETAFVFTSDHGMSDLGNHGDGDPDNTRTPLVVWGKGVKGRSDWEEPGEGDEYSVGWGLRGVRRDVEQADVAVLMSTLASIPYPANSAGRVPLDYLDASAKVRAEVAYANAKQLLAEAEAKTEHKSLRSWRFVPFAELVDSEPWVQPATLSPASHRREIEALLHTGEYAEAEKRSRELGEIALRASSYLQTYDWFLLRTIVTLGYLGSILYTLHFIASAQFVPTGPPSILATTLGGLQITVAILFVALCLRWSREHVPVAYYLYLTFPAVLWTLVLQDLEPLLAFFRRRPSAYPSTRRSPLSLALNSLLTLSFLAALAYGYTDRRAYGALALLMGAMGLPSSSSSSALAGGSGAGVGMQWAASLVALGAFTVLPVKMGEDLRVVGLGAALLVFGGFVALNTLPSEGSPTWSRTKKFLQIEILLTVLTYGVTFSSALSLQRKEGLPVVNQVAGWALLALSSSLPLLHARPTAQPTPERLSVLLLAFAPAFVLLSLSYEAAFYAVYCWALVSWARVEGAVARGEREARRGRKESGREGIVDEEEEEEGQLGLKHVRISLYFLAFLHLGFFGCGNVASISSFYLEPVYRLMTVFAPFPMGALLLFKLLIPFVALAAVSSVINRHLRLPPLSLFLVGSILSDFLTIYFFFRVTDTGSWLEIGSSITNFVILSLLGVFSSALLAGGEWLMKGTVG
ncbi:hypothetical protein JCM6882_005621 [Rhodosporidiobolus microsporus]